MAALGPQTAAPPPEWSARYAEYQKFSTDRAAQTAELNRQLMKLVARGEISPATLENRLVAFLATNGTAYAEELAAISSRFLTGLVAAGRSYSYELVERLVPGEVAPTARVVPDLSSGDWSNWLQRLTEYAAQENADVADMLRRVLERAASGSLDPQQAFHDSERFHGERLPDAVTTIATLYFDLLTQLDEAHSSFGARYVEELLGLAQPPQPSGAVLDLVGPIGGSATARFAVANNALRRTTLRAVMTDVRRLDGVGPAFEPDCSILPRRFPLEPGAEEILVVALGLAPDCFEAGPEYVGTVHVLSPDTTHVALTLHIRASAPPEPTPLATPESSPSPAPESPASPPLGSPPSAETGGDT